MVEMQNQKGRGFQETKIVFLENGPPILTEKNLKKKKFLQNLS